VHHSNVDAVMGKYADVMKEIDGNRAKTEVYAEIEGIIDAM
jgi:adenylate kinase